MKKKSRSDITEKLKSLIEIGVALSSEKELTNLMNLFLEKCLEVSGAEGASIYLIDKKVITHDSKDNPLFTHQKIPVLKFLKTLNRSIGYQEHSGVIDINTKSIAGYCALTKKVINIENCYDIDESAPYDFNDSFDQQTGYKTQSMLVVPMISAQGQTKGVLQLINKLNEEGLKEVFDSETFKDNDVEVFDEDDQELMRVFASQAAVAIENAQLTENIENLFESFVRASIKTIESRDPTTSGHSDRVATLTVEFALAAHKSKTGSYKNIFFSEEQIRELRYAALLHDFGKIGVTESTLLKQKKLHARELESILLRLDSLEFKHEAQSLRGFTQTLLQKVENGYDIDPKVTATMIHELNHELDAQKLMLRQMKSGVIQANEPFIINNRTSSEKILTMIEGLSNQLGHKVLTDQEVKRLSISRGSLSREERNEIESHVSHTYDFLKQIAWTDGLEQIPHIAHCHHEKMDGSGYPQGLSGFEIPIQARMMTIADIYDALVAFDRPYKKALSVEAAMDILIAEANSGKLDAELLSLFMEARIFSFISQQTKAV